MADMQSILSLIQSQSYLLIFILMIFEGPIVTVAASFAASLGLLDIYIIFLLSLLGNQVPDIFFYFIGRHSRGPRIERWLSKLGINKSKIKKLENGYKKHAGKTLTFIKLIPPLPVPGLILAGFTRVPIKKFLFISLLFNLVSTIVATLAGYYIGIAAGSIFKYFKIGEYALILIIPLVILLYLLFKRILTRVKKKIGDNNGK